MSTMGLERYNFVKLSGKITNIIVFIEIHVTIKSRLNQPDVTVWEPIFFDPTMNG